MQVIGELCLILFKLENDGCKGKHKEPWGIWSMICT